MRTDSLHALLAQIVDEDRIKVDEPMSAHTTFKVGGPVDLFIEPASIDEIAAVLQACRQENVQYHVIGCGSDLLVSDAGLEGVCIHLGEPFSNIDIDGNMVTAQAGATNNQVAAAACEAGLAGYEFASGIPGSIGGAAIMNAGAYEGEFSDVCSSVTCLTLDGRVVTLDAQQADFGYRHSRMSDEGMVVLEATLHLVPWNISDIQEKIDDLTCQRSSKQPLEYGSAGSTFKRPLGHFAGKLINDAGMRGHSRGGAMVSEKHCGFVINKGDATAEDILQVITDVQNAVFADSGVMLEPEVRMWGFDD